jgi:hypothetical protein
VTPAFLKRNSDSVAVRFVIACLLLPSVIWIFRDQSVWPWDQAYYGEMTLKIDTDACGLAGVESLRSSQAVAYVEYRYHSCCQCLSLAR